MKLLLAGLSGLLCGALGGLLAGCIASLCVEWYHISSFEGGSGYYVVLIAIGGILAGFALGAVSTLLVMQRQGSFAKGFGISTVILLVVAAVSLGLAWLFGDIPPTLNGDNLQLLVEVQCPDGWKPSKKMLHGENWISLDALSQMNRVRISTPDRIVWTDVKEQDGRTVIPAALYLSTSSGKRRLSITLEDTPALHFLLPLPPSPGAEYEDWSSWLPDNAAPDLAGGFRYRFRVMRDPLWQAAKEEIREQKVEALRKEILATPADAPLETWLRFQQLPDETEFIYFEERAERLHAVFIKRQDELSALLSHPNPDISRRALEAVLSLNEIPASAETPLRGLAARFATDLGKLRSEWDSQSPDPAAVEEIYLRMERWLNAWGLLLEKHKLPPLDLSPITAEAGQWKDTDAVKTIYVLLDDYKERWKAAENPAP